MENVHGIFVLPRSFLASFDKLCVQKFVSVTSERKEILESPQQKRVERSFHAVLPGTKKKLAITGEFRKALTSEEMRNSLQTCWMMDFNNTTTQQTTQVENVTWTGTNLFWGKQ